MADPDDGPDAADAAGPSDPSSADAAVATSPDTATAGTSDTDPPGEAGDAAAGIEAYTTDRRTLSPRVRVQWGARVLATTLVLGLVLSAGAARLNIDPRLGGVVALGVGLLGLVWVALRYRAWAYEVRADALYLQRGVLTHTRTLAPYVRIQHVDTSRGPLERGLGLSTLVVYTAGSRGADVSVPGLTPEEAADLQNRLKELAIEAEGGDAL